MYRLHDFLHLVLDLPAEKIQSDSVVCGETDAKSTLLTNKMLDSLNCYSFTLIKKGSLKILYNGIELQFHKNQLFIYSPGHSVYIKEISDDYQGLCLIAEERAVYESSMAHRVLQSLYFPVSHHKPKLELPDQLFHRLKSLMEDCIRYLNSNHKFKKEVVNLTVSLFYADLIDFIEKNELVKFNFESKISLVLAFLKLLPSNFLHHHTISFYATQLKVTPAHLSRVIKETTGKTAGNHIDRLLLMESCWRLASTDMQINEIADILNFADVASFSKFFKRHKGISPLNYRQNYL